MKIPALLALSGPGVFAIAQAPGLTPAEVKDWAEIGGLLLTVAGVLWRTEVKAGQGIRDAAAADQRATAIGRKVDELTRKFHDHQIHRAEAVGGQTQHNADVDRELLRHRDALHDVRKELGARIERLEERVDALRAKG